MELSFLEGRQPTSAGLGIHLGDQIFVEELGWGV